MLRAKPAKQLPALPAVKIVQPLSGDVLISFFFFR